MAVNVIRSPRSVPVAAAVPAGNSSAFLAPPPRAVRQGFMACTIFTTVSLRSRKITSIGNRMKNMWMELQGVMSSPPPGAKSRRPIRPQKRDHGLEATSAHAATVTPRVELVTRMVLIQAGLPAVLRRRDERWPVLDYDVCLVVQGDPGRVAGPWLSIYGGLDLV